MNLPKGFAEYLKPNTNRADFIQNYLLERGVNTAVISVEGKKHIYVRFEPSAYSATFRIKTVLSHYDIVQNSPGANDNSSGSFALMEFAVRLSKMKGVHNMRIFFTDGEELGEGGVESQGAYNLARLLKRLGIKNEDVFVFDCVGRGTVPILAKSVLPLGTPLSFARSYEELKTRAENILRDATAPVGGRWLCLPVSYSDNAGFLACGIPCVALTMLPGDEASDYLYALQKNPLLEDFVLNHNAHNTIKSEDVSILQEKLPTTWKLLHTPKDSLETLSSESFTLTARILDKIALTKSF